MKQYELEDGQKKLINGEYVAQVWLKPKNKDEMPDKTVVVMAWGERVVLKGDVVSDFE